MQTYMLLYQLTAGLCEKANKYMWSSSTLCFKLSDEFWEYIMSRSKLQFKHTRYSKNLNLNLNDTLNYYKEFAQGSRLQTPK